MMGRETTKEVSPFYEYCRKKSEWKESGLEALDLFALPTLNAEGWSSLP
jgi:hypothetical protein